MSDIEWDWNYLRLIIPIAIFFIIFVSVFIIWLCKRKKRILKRQQLQEILKNRPINQANLQTKYIHSYLLNLFLAFNFDSSFDYILQLSRLFKQWNSTVKLWECWILWEL